MVTAEMEAKIAKCVQALSEMRISNQGGYPDDWRIANVDGEDCVIIASVTHDDAPDLTIESVEDFIANFEERWPEEPEE